MRWVMLGRNSAGRFEIMDEPPDSVARTEQHIRHGILALGADADDHAIVTLAVDIAAGYLNDDRVIHGNTRQCVAPRWKWLPAGNDLLAAARGVVLVLGFRSWVDVTPRVGRNQRRRRASQIVVPDQL